MLLAFSVAAHGFFAGPQIAPSRGGHTMRKSGFTLIELLVVIAIMTVLIF
ncbi:MAG: prepilin-type N-terminal cleavage/methylation domain-containing protein [Fibrobacter sp.]|nr:prepilin-type N-terminal cleavage/methylation domain-containing protein [Fibrobacter sp.]